MPQLFGGILLGSHCYIAEKQRVFEKTLIKYC